MQLYAEDIEHQSLEAMIETEQENEYLNTIFDSRREIKK